MPSRAYTSFLLKRIRSYEFIIKQCQCPLGLIPHFYVSMKLLLYCIYACVNALSGLYLISTVCIQENRPSIQLCQCPLGLIPHFYLELGYFGPCMMYGVSMPSRAYTSFLLILKVLPLSTHTMCQCPLGLIPHFYVDENGDTFRIDFCVNALSGLYLISTNKMVDITNCGNRCQCPLGLIPHFYKGEGEINGK